MADMRAHYLIVSGFALYLFQECFELFAQHGTFWQPQAASPAPLSAKR
jgi:hypothetical protein